MAQEKFPDEVRLILYCAQATVDTSVQRKLQELLQSPLDWQLIIEQSYYHDILPLLYYNINKIHGQKICKSTFAMLKNAYYATLAKNMRLWREFCHIQNTLNNAGIKVILLKGIILAETLYYNLGLRPMADIDVLVQEKDLLVAEKQLIGIGYRKYLKAPFETYYRKYDYHFQFHNPGVDATLELHWAFAPPRPNKIDLTEVWERSKTIIINQREILTLSPEDTLVSLCLHICKVVKHLQHLSLKKMCDIHELISQHKHKLDWGYIADKVAGWRLKGSFYYLYLLTKRYFNTPWPTEELKKIYPYFIQRTILNFFIPPLGRISRFRAYLLMLTITDNTIDRLALGLQKFLMSVEKIFLISISRHDK